MNFHSFYWQFYHLIYTSFPYSFPITMENVVENAAFSSPPPLFLPIFTPLIPSVLRNAVAIFENPFRPWKILGKMWKNQPLDQWIIQNSIYKFLQLETEGNEEKRKIPCKMCGWSMFPIGVHIKFGSQLSLIFIKNNSII